MENPERGCLVRVGTFKLRDGLEALEDEMLGLFHFR